MTATRRRGAELDGAITAAVLGELAERGYPSLTFEGVAARAATGKAVLYRRWGTRAEMVMAAVVASTTESLDHPDTGSLVEDLRALLHSMRDNFGASGRSTMLGLLAELDQEAADSLGARVFDWGAHLVEPLVAQARARGELGPGDLPTPVLALPLDLARHELAFRGQLTSDRVEEIVETLVVPLMQLHGADPGTTPT